MSNIIKFLDFQEGIDHFDTTLSTPHLLFCRISIPLSQQLRQESSNFLGKEQKSPYLCISFKFHTIS